MRLFSFLLFYKAFSFLTILVSPCSPEIKGGNLISISLSSSPDWRFNIDNIIPNVGINVIVYNGNDQPDDNEIFMLKQPTTGVYEFRPFNDFRRTKTFEIPAANINNVGAPFILNYSTNEGANNQRFIIECCECNPDANSLHWTIYYSSCSIMNSASRFCASGEKVSHSIVTQIDCAAASRWDLWGMISPDAILSSETTSSGSPTMATMTNSGVITVSGLIATVFGSIIGTALISFIIGYWIIKRKQPNYEPSHAVGYN